MTLEQKLREVILSEDYKLKSDPLKINKTITDDGEKYRAIDIIYKQYLIDAKNEMRKEWSLFTHKDDKKRTLSKDISKQKINKLAITKENRTDKSLIESLVKIQNYN
jgi:vacuolar-type H+-ATPase subunit I/STV1